MHHKGSAVIMAILAAADSQGFVMKTKDGLRLLLAEDPDASLNPAKALADSVGHGLNG